MLWPRDNSVVIDSSIQQYLTVNAPES